MDLFAWLDAQTAAQVIDSGGTFDIVAWCAALVATAFIALLAFVAWCAFTTPRRSAGARGLAATPANEESLSIESTPITRTAPVELPESARLAPVSR